jgi:LysR family transcriptional regulator, regulator of abg operon
MKLTQLQDLVAIALHGSVRAASRQTGVLQPALTRSLSALEKELGVPLFAREARGMTLTAEGQRFHQRASAIVHEARRALDELAQAQGDDQGELFVALSIMPHVGMLPHALPRFRERYPRVRLRIIEGLFPDVERRLRDGSLDFYLGAAPRVAPAPGLQVRTLFENTRTVVCRKGHPLARADSLKALTGASWATTSIDYNVAEDLKNLFARYRLGAPSVMLQAQSALSMMVALAHSDLLALLPVQWQDFPLTRGALQSIAVKERLPAPSIVMIKRADLPLTPAADFFCDVLCRFGPQPAVPSRRTAAHKS